MASKDDYRGLYKQYSENRKVKGKQYLYFYLSRWSSSQKNGKIDKIHLGKDKMSEERLAIFNEDFGGRVPKPKGIIAKDYATMNENDLAQLRQVAKVTKEAIEEDDPEKIAAAKKELLRQKQQHIILSTRIAEPSMTLAQMVDDLEKEEEEPSPPKNTQPLRVPEQL